MSLLIDALRKAERTKKQSEAVSLGAVPEPNLALEPVVVGDSQVPQSPASASAAERSAILNAFAVKKEANKNIALLTMVAGLLAAGGIGSYFWWQLRPASSPQATRSAPSTILQTPALQATLPAAKEVSPDVRTPSVPAAQASLPDTRPGKALRPASVAPKEQRATMARQAPAVEAAAQIAVTAPQLKPDALTTEAYAAFQGGNLAIARAAYEKLLQADPRNSDALHGLAAVALREGRTDAAAAAYIRILEANPADAAAHAGLIGLDVKGDPVASENRIRPLLAAQPDMPVLNFALGNLYARQNRWGEAQQAYFKAVSGDSSSPDYLFNLAVSLDQLHQPRLAAQYYGRALVAAEGRPAAFDRTQATTRLRQLQP